MGGWVGGWLGGLGFVWEGESRRTCGYACGWTGNARPDGDLLSWLKPKSELFNPDLFNPDFIMVSEPASHTRELSRTLRLYLVSLMVSLACNSEGP